MSGSDPQFEHVAATQLGRLARALDGDVRPSVDAAGRERMLRALASSRSPRRRWAYAAAGGAALAVAALWLTRGVHPAPIEYHISGSGLRSQGTWLGVAPDRGSGLLRFSEGTQIELEPGSKSRVAELTQHGAHVVLGSGALRAHVVHRPDTHWQVGAGPYAIDVTGTAFDVEWSEHGGRLEVRLHEGSVIVRGPALHEGIRVSAGQRLVAHARTGEAKLSPLEPPPSALRQRRAPARPATHRVANAPTHPPPSWTDLLTNGNFRAIVTLARARGIETTLRRGSLADIVALSDAARYAGEPALARRGLLAQRGRFPASAEAHAAAFLLGRMADEAQDSAEALRWYGTYLRRSPHGAFAAEALGCKLVVLERSGQHVAARALAATYLRRFADGPHAVYARELLRRP